MSNAAEPTERHKKGIKTSTSGTSNTLATSECQPKPLPGLEYLEDLDDKDPMVKPECMIVENHGIEQGQKVQTDTLRLRQSTNKPTQRGVKHDLSDPHTRENEHLVQEAGQGLEHMVVEDHGPKKGMAPQSKPQFNPLFFPFATCLPDFSIPQDYDLKEKRNSTPEAHAQTLTMGRESNDNQNKHELESSKVNTMSTDPIQSELTSPWPDQWRLEELDNDMTDLEDPWPEMEGIDAWNDDPDIEELDPTKNASYATPWGLLGEPRWITELNYAIEPEPEEDPCPLTLHEPDKDNESTMEGELSPQTSNNIPDQKETWSLQNNQCNEGFLDERSPKCQITGSTSDDEEGTTKINQLPTHQKSTRPTSDDEEGTMIVEPTSLDARTPLQNKEAPGIGHATRGENLHRIHTRIRHPDMT